jgi:hypothetical protein
MTLDLYLKQGYEGRPGLLDTSARQQSVRNESGSSIAPGRLCVVTGGSDIPTVKLISASSDRPLGVALNTTMAGDIDVALPDADVGTVLYRGSIYVVPEVAVDPSDPVYVRHTSHSSPGTYDAIGRFRNDADTDGSDTAMELPKCRWISASAAGGLAILEFAL